MSETVRKRLLHEMTRIRLVEEAIADLYPRQEMRCPVHLCIGQEAVSAGVCAALRADDYVMSTHRSHGHYLAKGGALKPMMAELHGKATGCCRGKGGSMHLVDLSSGFLGATPIVGSSIPIAVGAAFGTVMRGEDRVTAVFFGDGATEEGTFCESLNFAALKRLPVVFVCENNHFSVYSPLSVRQPEGHRIATVARGHGVEAFQGDGNDAVEVHDLARRAVEKARSGGGPTFLEFETYRWREHCGPNFDDDLGYRGKADADRWRCRCPVDRLRSELLAAGEATAEEVEAMEARIRAEVEEAVAFAAESPFPSEDTLVEDLFAPSPSEACR
ncbi:MAG: thiamine pyrophosphate-dependent dehydrogenase E1 component subunit alpha [Deltaproteobacteria bacterium]|nr:thiamine pyrophosphate-dependent dehydrogenase E1 component subunit alpha [Deltaproteobacteria bacterium]